MDLFGCQEVPSTEGIKYAGSKLKLLPFIIQVTSSIKNIKNILDGFSGTTRVTQAFAQLGYNVVANDISEWSEVFATCYLLSNRPDSYYKEIIDYLNSLDGYSGWYTENYGGTEDDPKHPFQFKNTMKLDAIRDELDKMGLQWPDKCVILTSLIYALDSVDNTLGHYAAYLSKWSSRSYNDLKLKLPHRFLVQGKCNVIKDDIFNTIKMNHFDFTYFDPPYGSNNEKMPPSRVRYSSYYHIWTTVILNDKPNLFGHAARREDSRDTVSSSIFEEFRKDDNGHYIAMKAIEKLLKETMSTYILLSYSSGGRATKDELCDIINNCGHLVLAKEINYKANVMSNMSWTHEWINLKDTHKEYLFLLKK